VERLGVSNLVARGAKGKASNPNPDKDIPFVFSEVMNGFNMHVMSLEGSPVVHVGTYTIKAALKS
jgi:hypothetical protein